MTGSSTVITTTQTGNGICPDLLPQSAGEQKARDVILTFMILLSDQNQLNSQGSPVDPQLAKICIETE